MALTPSEVHYGRAAVQAGWIDHARLLALSEESQRAGRDLRAHLLGAGALTPAQDQALLARLRIGPPTPSPAAGPLATAPGGANEAPTRTGSGTGVAAIPLHDTTHPGSGSRVGLLGKRLPSPGDRLGPYLVERELARGGLGAVFVARGPAGEPLALKVLLDPTQGNHLARFEREAEVGMRLTHPGICAVLDAGEHQGIAYLTMPFLEGARSITDYCEEERLSSRERVALMVQVVEALHFAHEAGVVHRDLKPGNVLVTPDGRAKVVDFGLVKDLERSRLTASGQIMGTPYYMAPEQVRGDGAHVDRRCDVFALGVILFELLAGERPFESDTSVGILHAILNAELPDLGAAAGELPGVVEVLRVATAKEPDQRYADAAELAYDLGAVLGGSALSGRVRAGRRARWQRRAVIGLGLGAALVVASLIGVLTWRARAARVLAADRRERSAALAEAVGRRLAQRRSLVTHPLELEPWLAELAELEAPGAGPELELAAARVRFAEGAAALARGDAEAAAAALERLPSATAETALLREALAGALVGVGARAGEPAGAARALAQALGQGVALPELRGWRALAIARDLELDRAEAEEVRSELRELARARPLEPAERTALARAALAADDLEAAAEALAGVAAPPPELTEALALAQAARRLAQQQPALALERLRQHGAPIRGHLARRRELRDGALKGAAPLVARMSPGQQPDPADRQLLLDLLHVARAALPEEPLPPSVRDPLLDAAQNGITPDYMLGVELAQLMPDDFVTQSSVGLLLIRSGRTEEELRGMLAAARRALDLAEVTPADPTVCEDLAVALIGHGLAKSGLSEQVLEESERRMALFVTPVARKDVLAHRAWAYFLLGRDEEALAEIERAFAVGIRDQKLHYYRFKIFERLGRLEEAFADAYAFAISGVELGGPRHLDAVVMIWEWGRPRGRADEVRLALESYLRDEGEHAGWRTRAALLQLEVGRVEDARANLERASRALAAHPQGRVREVAPWAAKAAAALPGRPGEALAELKALVERLDVLRGAGQHGP